MNQLLIDDSEVGEILALTARQVERMARRGEIPFVRLPNKEIRYDPIDIEIWLQAIKARGDEGTP